MAREDVYYYCETQPEYDPEWHWITDQIALGSYPLDPALNDLMEQGITAIVSVRYDEPDYDLDLFEAAHVVQVEDRYPFPYDTLVGILRFLHEHVEAGRKVYVHCFAGMSRSPLVVACYLMLRENLRFDDALARIRAIRAICSPHPGLFSMELVERLVVDRERILALEPSEVS